MDNAVTLLRSLLRWSYRFLLRLPGLGGLRRLAEQFVLFRLDEDEWKTLRDATDLGARGHLLAVRSV